jgi:uncharacterized protein YndB with AHSA1/START domain
MPKTGALTVTAQGDRGIVMTRSFNAPRRLVWEAYTNPELVKRWLLGPDGWYFNQCDMDFRVGGKYRYVWKNDEKGQTMGMGGEYREINKPGRIVNTEKFDDFPGEALTTLELAEHNGVTTLVLTVQNPSREARDGMLQSGMEKGVARSYERLDDVLGTMSSQPAGSVA